MTGKHTPGPWRILNDGIDIANFRGIGICRLCDVTGYNKANAALIAAAPETAAERDSLKAINAELLKLLTELLKAYDEKALEMNSPEIDLGDPEIPPHPWHEEWISYARATIAKHKGGGS